MYTFRGSNTNILNFVSLYKGGQLVRERTRSSRKKTFFQELTPFLKGVLVCISKYEVTKVDSLYKLLEIYGCVAIHLHNLFFTYTDTIGNNFVMSWARLFKTNDVVS